MQQELNPLDISSLPGLERIVEEVRATGKPCRIVRGGEDLAVLTPPRPRRRSASGNPQAKEGNPGDPSPRAPENVLLRLVEIGSAATLDEDEPTDISANKHKYLANVYAKRPPVQSDES